LSRSIKLLRYEVENVNYDYYGLFRLRIEAADPVGVDPRVFVYLRKPRNPHTGEYEDLFQAVASPVDLVEYPPEEPNSDDGIPFFRKSFVELDFRSTADAEEVWNEITREVDVLVEALDRFENLSLTQVYVAGDASNYDSDSDSESESD